MFDDANEKWPENGLDNFEMVDRYLKKLGYVTESIEEDLIGIAEDSDSNFTMNEYHRDEIVYWLLEKRHCLSPKFFVRFLKLVKNQPEPRFSSMDVAKKLKEYFFKLKEDIVNADKKAPIMEHTGLLLKSMLKVANAKSKLSFKKDIELEEVTFAYNLFKAILENHRSLGQESKEDKAERAKQIKGINKSDVGNLSIPKQTKAFLEVVSEEAQKYQNFVFPMADLKAIGKAMNLNVGCFTDFIERLNLQGLFLKKNNGVYELLVY